MQVDTFTVGEMATNCYLVYADEHALVVDPGDSADYITTKLIEKSLKVEMVAATHGHFDHVLAAFELSQNFNCPFALNKKDDFLLKRMASSAQYFLGKHLVAIAPKIDINLDQVSAIQIGNEFLEVVKTPGHTPGSVCLYNKKDDFVLVGDLIFNDGSVGRDDRTYSDKNQLSKSIEKILKLPQDSKVFPGHGPEFFLKDLTRKEVF